MDHDSSLEKHWRLKINMLMENKLAEFYRSSKTFSVIFQEAGSKPFPPILKLLL